MFDKSTEPQGMWRYRRPLKRSGIKWEALSILSELYPGGARLEDLVRVMQYSKVDVLGAFVGYRMRFKKEDSLVALGLVSHEVRMVDDRPVEVFLITCLGLEVRNHMKDQISHSFSSVSISNMVQQLRDEHGIHDRNGQAN